MCAVCKDCTRGKDAENYHNRKERKLETSLEWAKNNRWYGRQKMKARKRGYKPEHTEQEWLEVLNRLDGKCAECGTSEDITKDHIIPIKRGGTDHISNIQPLCRSCNSKKGDKLCLSANSSTR